MIAAGGDYRVPIPAVPRDLSVARESSYSLRVSWRRIDDATAGYDLQRATGAADFRFLVHRANPVHDYTNTGLASDTTYRYRVRACNDSGCSRYSNARSGTTAEFSLLAVPNPPVITSVIAVFQLNIKWTNVPGATAGYVLARSTSAAGVYAAIARPGQNVTTYADNGLAGNTTYYYKVKACDKSGCSAYSAFQSASTPNTLNPSAPVLALAAAKP